ncbi:PREDICTED: beta-galactosidase 7-like [Tarenaya hassleriana]|uniref:beta-galactosidase 7-like n=1 Tax=Tarenaya hassleriana TaxID=28532 RepID=UPI00053C40FB|nr:PREDICTED: beta-galactosidase 7-like [Tarenaya hassleriana]
MKHFRSPLFLFFLIVVFSASLSSSTIVSHDERAITIDGQRRILISGSIHYPRSTVDMWPDLINKAKDGGLDAIETYVFWNAHEPARRQYDFSDNLDLVRFVKTVQDAGLYAVLRIGPYVCAEWNYGGFPVWLHNMPNVEFRTTNTDFMNEMQNFTTLIVDMMKREKLFAVQGGPIILAQIENEYGNVIQSYGAAGKAYIDWCSNMADSLDIGVPWIMCQETDAPEPMIETCNGFYCHDYKPTNPSNPKMWTENWTGWFKNWGGKHPFRTAEDLSFAVARFFQTGGTFQNYYMYHGGTNFGRTAGGPYITTSYDYHAPLDEFGNLNQPKWGHLKELHNVLKSMERSLTYGNISDIDMGNSVTVTTYATSEGSSCFISNANTTVDAVVSFQGNQYNVPAWSVSVLPDCKKEVYNTAKVSTQESVMVAEDAHVSGIQWSWRPEMAEDTILKGKGDVVASGLFDQKAVANDASDYLWYMTRVHLDKSDPIWSHNMSLRVHSNAHVLHAYVNGEHVGTHFVKDGKYDYDFEKSVKLVHGTNRIALLSVTVGFHNYGAFFEKNAAGINGPVSIVGYKGDERIEKDLSGHQWEYKIGLNGIENKVFSPDSASNLKWSTQQFPTFRMLTWYKTPFDTPSGNSPVVVDLNGLGKGEAWINGRSIGRYWPSFDADNDGCSEECDYRGPYDSNKCAFKCGEPTQRLYHVPRDFLNGNSSNTLTLLEEMGGDPSMASFKTIGVGSACARAEENKVVELSCNGKPISAVKFVSFGNPTGKCGSFAKGMCDGAEDAEAVASTECVGKMTCKLEASSTVFGAADCGDLAKSLAVEVVC